MDTNTNQLNVPENIVKPKSNKGLILIFVIICILLLFCTLSILVGLVLKNRMDGANINTTNEITTVPTRTDSPSSITKPDFTHMPGTTVCDATLCSDTWDSIATLANVYANCANLSLKDTKSKLTSNTPDNQSYSETWTLTGCNRDFPFAVTYTTGISGGTDFAVSKKF